MSAMEAFHRAIAQVKISEPNYIFVGKHAYRELQLANGVFPTMKASEVASTIREWWKWRDRERGRI